MAQHKPAPDNDIAIEPADIGGPDPGRALAPALGLGALAPTPLFNDLWTSLDMSKRADFARLLRAVQVADLSGKDAIGMTFRIRDVAAFSKVITDEQTGEERDVIVVILWDASGETVATTGITIWDTIRGIMSRYGMPPWDPPVRVRMAAVRTRRNREMLILEIDPETED